MQHNIIDSLVAVVLLSGCVLQNVDGQDADFYVNVAYGKPATQSTTYLGNPVYSEYYQFPYNASLAVDGITATNFHNGSCSHTDVNQPNAWWEVDLQVLYDISSIKIYQRSDANQDWLKGFVVKGKQNDGSYLIIHQSGSYATGEINISLQPKMQFKAIRIELAKDQAFICLCEVEVFTEVNVAQGKPASQSSTYVGSGDDYGHYNASLAVDGNTDTRFSHKSCSQTNPTEMSVSWWKVILNGHFPVIGLRIYQRSDENVDWLDGYRLYGKQGEREYELISTPSYTLGLITITPSNVKIFSEIKIELNGAGWKGICLCEVQVFAGIDKCVQPTACPNREQCFNTKGGFSCHCNAGYTGTTCESDIDECTPMGTACHNHGVCSNTFGGFLCRCDTGYTGHSCESDLDECTTMTTACNNHGQCSNTDGGFSCRCDTGYTGTSCESVIRCDALRQPEFGTHLIKAGIEGNWTYNTTVAVECNPGYSLNGDSLVECTNFGKWNETLGNCSDIDECATMGTACHNNGECSNTDGGFSCRCNTGYTGHRCESDIDECSTMTTTCHNHGQCSNKDGGFSCHCDTGYTGTSCESGISCHIPEIDSTKGIYELHPVFGGNASYTSYLTITCKEGYRLLGSDIIRCTSTGEWDKSIGQCTVIQCSGRFILPNNSVYLYEEGIEGNLTYNSTISIRCKEGYKVSGTDLIRCNELGAWDRQFGTCRVIDCGWPEDVPHDVQVLIIPGIAGGFSYNATACIQSNEELKRVGNIYESLRCSSNGSWRGNLGKCFETTKKEAYMDQDGQTITLPIAIILPICLILIATNFVTLLKLRRCACYREQPSEQFQVDMTIADHFNSSQNGITEREQTMLSHSNGDTELEMMKIGSEETHSHGTGPYSELQKDHRETSDYDELKFKRD